MDNNMQFQKIFGGTWRITEGLGRGAVHCYLLEGNKAAVLIDTGLGGGELKGIVTGITKKPVKVINTHGHLDHIGKNYEFEEVFMHPEDEGVFREHSSFDAQYRYFYGRYLSKGITLTESELLELCNDLRARSILQQRNNRYAIHDGETICLGGRDLNVVWMPGHTKGSICILDSMHKMLFTGDSICEEGVLLYFTHSETVGKYRESLTKLKYMGNEFTMLYPSHQKTPLTPDWIDEYAECADQVLSGNYGAEMMSASSGKKRKVAHKRALLTY